MKKVILLVVIFFATQAYADSVTVTWAMKINGITDWGANVNTYRSSSYASDYFKDGDSIWMSYTYDTVNDGIHYWYDGANGIAEFGGGDDSLYTCTFDNPINQKYDVFTDLSGFSFSANIEEYFADKRMNADRNKATIVQDIYGNVTTSIMAEGSWLTLRYKDDLTIDGFYLSEKTWDPTNYVRVFDNLQFESVSYTRTAPVPEPATMLLFGSGLAVFGVFRKKKK